MIGKNHLEKIDPESYAYQLALKASGLVHSLIGIIPEQYNWIAGSLGFKGSIKIDERAKKINNSNLEVSREDHANIIKRIRK